MAEMLLPDHLEELWVVINQQHLLYLSEESPRKLDRRDKLETYIREYLCIAPHNRKFTFPQTAQVLHRSVSTKENFNGYRAAVAWKAIGKYADNLIVQPWRKEFKDLKLYCGFYKHEVEQNLADAELMFEAMGYCRVGNSTMTITDIVDPDRIISVSKDAIIAYVECQILKQIWENLLPHYKFSWLEILEFRENHTGTSDQAFRTLMYRRRQRQYEEQMYRRSQYHLPESHVRPDYAYSSNPDYFNHMHYGGHSYSYPEQSRYSSGMSVPHIASPNSAYPPQVQPPYVAQHAIKPQDLYPANGYVYSHHYPQQMNSSQSIQDSYYNYPNYHSVHPQQSAVPTAQLIELDSTPVHNSCDLYGAERSSNQLRYPDEDDVRSKWQDLDKNGSSFPSGRAKDDGAGSWENWDYVYRNLESQGYKRNLASRGESSSKGNVPGRSNTSDSDVKAQSELADKMKKMNVNPTHSSKLEATSSKNATIHEEKPKSKSVVRSASAAVADLARDHHDVGTMPEIQTNGTSPEGKRFAGTGTAGAGASAGASGSGSSPVSAASGTIKSANEPRKDSLPRSETSSTGKKSARSFEPGPESAENKWECITCTYLNPEGKQICEMCFKSRERGDESKPQPTGGQECSHCTLVNEPGLNFCLVCGKPLKNSPTYI